MKSLDLDEEVLKKLYVDKKKTSYEIAEILQVSRTTVIRYLKKFNIDVNPKQRKFELIKKVPLTKEQKEMIVGTVLGDGCIAPHGRKNKSYRLIVGHCEKQKDLLFFKKAYLGNLVNIVNCREDNRQNSIMYSFNTVTHQEFKFFYDLFYENNKKVIKDALIMHLSPRSLAFWIMDDGSNNKVKNNVNLRLHTECFTEEENIKLQSMLKASFDLRSKVCKFNRNNKEYCYLSFNKENTIKTSNIVQEYFEESMKYKLYADPQRLECQSLSNIGNDDTV